jgi:hypothetical protein
MAKFSVITNECEPITIEALRVFPNLSREMPRGIIMYKGQEVKPFYDLAQEYNYKIGRRRTIVWLNLPDDERFIREIKDKQVETQYEDRFKTNWGEWLILDNPQLTAIRWRNWEKDGQDTITPVAVMTVTHNGNNAYTVYIPLWECCHKSIDYPNETQYLPRYRHYYKGGCNWEERPFPQIMNMLRQNVKITYSYYLCQTYNRFGTQILRSEEGGGFRVL